MRKLYYVQYNSFNEDEGHNSYIIFKLYKDKSRGVVEMNEIIKSYKRIERQSYATSVLNKGGYANGQEYWYAYGDEYELIVRLSEVTTDIDDIDDRTSLYVVTKSSYYGTGFDDYTILSTFDSKEDARVFLVTASKEEYDDYKIEYDYDYILSDNNSYASLSCSIGETESTPSLYYRIERLTVI